MGVPRHRGAGLGFGTAPRSAVQLQLCFLLPQLLLLTQLHVHGETCCSTKPTHCVVKYNVLRSDPHPNTALWGGVRAEGRGLEPHCSPGAAFPAAKPGRAFGLRMGGRCKWLTRCCNPIELCLKHCKQQLHSWRG